MDAENLRHLDILGVRVHDVTLSEALDTIARFVADGSPHQVATVNPEFVMAAQANAAFRAVLNRAALCVPDGIGLVWASRWLARRPGDVRLRERVAGVELTEQLAARAASAGWRVFLLGAAPGVAEKTARILEARYPGLSVAGAYDGSPSAEEEDAIVAMVRQAQTDVLLVAYGAPAQDMWIARNLDRLGVSVALGVGGSFDFISGVARRAPRWVQRLGLEWLHRLICQPWRLRRQLAIPRFMWRVAGARPGAGNLAGFLIPFLLFAGVLALYVSALAPWAVPGDPSEYIFVPHVLGIAHPPGYAFYTVLAWLWQNVVRVGTLSYRTNLLAAAAGAAVSTLVYATIVKISHSQPETWSLKFVPSLFGGLCAAAAVDIWQHSLHANAHIVSALLATLALFLLVRWQATQDERWLRGLALVAGFSVTQHPLLVFGFPAYAVFVLLAHPRGPRFLLQWRQVLVLAAFFALGLSVWLYIPLRGPTAPFNRMDRTLEAFWRHVTAQGLRVNLFAFGLNDQPVRLNVFGQLLSLQYSPVTLALAGLGAVWLAARRSRLFVLLALFLAIYVLFVINTIQDVMAYLMLPFVVVAMLAGAGAKAALSLVPARPVARLFSLRALASVGLILVPLYTAWQVAPRVGLAEYRAGQAWVETVTAQFDGKGEGAILLAPWELMTPLWVAEAEGRPLDPADVTPVYVAATSANPFLDNVLIHWGQGPVYLADFRRGVWEGGLFRLRPTRVHAKPSREAFTPSLPPSAFRLPPSSFLWRVVAPGDPSIPAGLQPLNVMAEGQVELVGYDLDTRSLRPGQTAHLVLAMRAPTTPTHYLAPFALLGERAYRWTTDSRVLSLDWQPGEVIVELYDVTIPYGTPPASYPLRLGVADLSAGRDLPLAGAATIDLGEIAVEPARGVLPPQNVLDRALANFDSRVALMGARVCIAGRCQPAPWASPPDVRPGQVVEIWLDWRVLQQAGDSYKAFVHLIRNDQLAAPPADDYTPLGGAFPSLLWIPRWIEGQAVSDPYRLLIPGDLAPGKYGVEIGLYGLTSVRRAPIFDRAGNLAGDRFILGALRVSAP